MQGIVPRGLRPAETSATNRAVDRRDVVASTISSTMQSAALGADWARQEGLRLAHRLEPAAATCSAEACGDAGGDSKRFIRLENLEAVGFGLAGKIERIDGVRHRFEAEEVSIGSG